LDLDPVFRSRVQFAFVIWFRIVFPALTIGLASWLATSITPENVASKQEGSGQHIAIPEGAVLSPSR
jgi:cytochrome bd-type quinol oxidase subunit 1